MEDRGEDSHVTSAADRQEDIHLSNPPEDLIRVRSAAAAAADADADADAE